MVVYFRCRLCLKPNLKNNLKLLAGKKEIVIDTPTSAENGKVDAPEKLFVKRTEENEIVLYALNL